MSTFVVTTDGDRVNLDRLARIRFEVTADELGLILGSTRTNADDDEVVLVEGPAVDVGRVWQDWNTYARDGIDLAAALARAQHPRPKGTRP